MTTKITFLSLSFLFLFASLGIAAQNISGNVIDEQNEPIEFASVVLFSLPDSTLITGVVTNENGEFSLNGNGGEAFLQISFIGYETRTVAAAQNQTVVLKPAVNELGELIVQGNLPRTRLRNDAIVTTVENTVLSQAGTGNDVLQRLPLITGGDGEFSVLGKGEAIIYINNRRMRDPSEMDNLNSADIREVEIVTNPGARYDASVNAVIRIRTVRRAGDGFSFDVRSSFFQPDNIHLTQQLNVNYRKNGWDIFGTLFYEEDKGFQDAIMRQRVNVDTLWLQENRILFDSFRSTLRGIVGVNYEISPEHSAGVRYSLTSFPNSWSRGDIRSTVSADGEFFDIFDTAINETRKWQPAHHINAYYVGEFGDLKVDFNTDFFSSESLTNSVTTEASQEFDDRIITTNSDVLNRLIASRLILSYPVLGGQFTLGSEYTNIHRRDNFYNKEAIVESSNTTINEQNKSVFAEFSREISFGQFRAGLRYENVRNEFLVNDVRSDEQSRQYHQWFPSASFSTRIQGVGVQLSYTARTQRPTFWQLRNHVTYANRFTMQTGNPFLRPTTIHDATLTSTWRFLQLMVSYRNTHNAIIFWAEQMEENPAITMLSHRNLDRLPSFTAFLSAAPTFGIWSPQASVGMTKQWLTITSNNEPLSLNKPTFSASLNNSFSLPRGFLFTLDTRFQGRGHFQNVYLNENIFVVNAGITKSFFNEQLRVELRGHDIFWGRKDASVVYNRQMEIFQNSRFDSQRVELTVRYRFNSARNRYRGTGAGQNQINRL
jgi:hypothetical protein